MEHPTDIMEPMRESHPGLFRAMLKMGAFSLINGLGMLVWPSRMPDWLPPPAVGIIGVIASVAVIVGSFAKVETADLGAAVFAEPPQSHLVIIARIALAVLAVLYIAMAISLFAGWNPTPGAPGAVTQSLDRVLLYALGGGTAIDLLREPVSNPASAHRES